jgi:hypothetical protein
MEVSVKGIDGKNNAGAWHHGLLLPLRHPQLLAIRFANATANVPEAI